MPTIVNRNSLANPIGEVRTAVFVRRSWSEPWQYFPFLQAVEATTAAAPEVDVAQFKYFFGTVQRQGWKGFGYQQKTDLVGWWVQIRTVSAISAAEPIWTGIITEPTTALVSKDPVGYQLLVARGVAHILDLETVCESWAWENPDDDVPISIDWVPVFNERAKRGRSLLGNRSEDPYTDDDDNSYYVFSRAGEVWNNRQIVELLLQTAGPKDFKVELAGQLDILEAIEEVHDLMDLSLWQCLNKLIDRRRGAGFVLIPFDDVVRLVVFSVSDRAIKVGERELPANPMPVTFSHGEAFPQVHLPGDIHVRRTHVQRVNRLLIRGERIKVVGTFSFKDGTLEKFWTDALETEYLTAKGTNPLDNDRFRGGDKFENVFSAFRVPTKWDGKVGDAKGGEKKNILLFVNKDGLIEEEESGDLWRFGKQFATDLPFEVGKKYDADDPDDNPPDTEPEFRPMLVLYHDTQDGPNHKKTDKWLVVDRLQDIQAEFPGVNIRPLEKELGFRLDAGPRHAFAFDQWADNPGATRTAPEFGFKNLAVTAMLELDTRVQISLERFSPGGNQEIGTTVVVNVPGAEYWYAPTTVIWDVDGEGQPIYVGKEQQVLRYADQIIAAASQAAAWYGIERIAVQIPIKRIGVFVPIGAMLTAITDRYQLEEIRTPITARHWNFEQGLTVIETGFTALDFSDQMF